MDSSEESKMEGKVQEPAPKMEKLANAKTMNLTESRGKSCAPECATEGHSVAALCVTGPDNRSAKDYHLPMS
jgi:hypothetical protein